MGARAEVHSLHLGGITFARLEQVGVGQCAADALVERAVQVEVVSALYDVFELARDGHFVFKGVTECDAGNHDIAGEDVDVNLKVQAHWGGGFGRYSYGGHTITYERERAAQVFPIRAIELWVHVGGGDFGVDKDGILVVKQWAWCSHYDQDGSLFGDSYH